MTALERERRIALLAERLQGENAQRMHVRAERSARVSEARIAREERESRQAARGLTGATPRPRTRRRQGSATVIAVLA